MDVICCYIDCELITTSHGDNPAILDPGNVTGGRKATVSCAAESGILTVTKS